MAQRVASGSQGRLNRRFLLVAVLLAGLSAALVYARISATDSGGSNVSNAGGGNIPVVVASIPIKERTLITENMLEIKNVPAGAAAIGAFGNIEDVVGTVAKYPVEVNQQVLSTSVIDSSRPLSGAELSVVIPSGKRAFSIKASEVANAGGLVLPGDWVDITWACCKDYKTVSRTIVRNVQVAAVAQSIVSSGPVVGATPEAGEDPQNPIAASAADPIPAAVTLTLLVTSEEAQRLLIAEEDGTLRIALRGPSDSDATEPELTKITDEELLPPSVVFDMPESLKPPGYATEQ